MKMTLNELHKFIVAAWVCAIIAMLFGSQPVFWTFVGIGLALVVVASTFLPGPPEDKP